MGAKVLIFLFFLILSCKEKEFIIKEVCKVEKIPNDKELETEDIIETAEEIICIPLCDGKECGNDGCGGNCGKCKEGFFCKEGVCVEDIKYSCGDMGGFKENPIWPMEGFCPTRTSRSPYKGPSSPNIIKLFFDAQPYKIPPKNQFETCNMIPPIIDSDNMIYIALSCGVILAINPDGTLRWKIELENDFIASIPAIAKDGTIYFGTSNKEKLMYEKGKKERYFYALKNGNIKWKIPMEVATSSAVIAGDGTIYIGSAYSLYSIEPSGNIKWKWPIKNGAYHSSPAIGLDGNIYVGSESGALYCFSPEGKLIWKFEKKTEPVYSGPVIFKDGTIFFGTYNFVDNSSFFAINKNGEEKWMIEINSSIYASPSLGYNGEIYLYTVFSSSQLIALYKILQNGEISWQVPVSFGSSLSPTIDSDGNIYFASDYNLYSLTPDKKFRWILHLDFPVYASLPIDNKKTIYIAGGNKLYTLSESF